jgi:hypothetical protein
MSGIPKEREFKNGNMNEIVVQKNYVINNINSNVNLSSFLNFGNESGINDSNITDDNLTNFNNLTNITPNITPNVNPFTSLNINNDCSNLTNLNLSTSSFNTNSTNEPLGIDLNSFLKNNKNMDETVHDVSQTNDIPIIQEINDQHQSIKSVIAKRFNSIKMVSNWWTKSDFSSAINALNLMKDSSVINDFLKFALISRDDFSRIKFIFEHLLSLFKHSINLINSKYEAYCLTGCQSGLILLRKFSELSSTVKNSSNQNIQNIQNNEQLKICEAISEILMKIFSTSNLDKLRQRKKNKILSEIAENFYTDLEFCLKSYKK